MLNKNTNTQSKGDGWCAIRIRTATLADLNNLVSKSPDGVRIEKVDDVINRHKYTVELLHNYLVKKKFPDSDIVDVGNDLEVMYCISTNSQQMKQDLEDYYARHEAHNQEQEQLQHQQTQKEYDECTLADTPEQREKDALEARQQKENYYSLKNTQRQEQLEKESM